MKPIKLLKLNFLFFLVSSAFLASVTSAHNLNIINDLTDTQTIIVPNCLLSNTTLAYKLIANNTTFSLIQANSLELAKLTTAANYAKIDGNTQSCGKFQDVSQEWQNFANDKQLTPQSSHDFLLAKQSMSSPATNLVASNNYPDKINYESIVRAHIAQIKPDRFWDNLKQLSDPQQFPDRFAKSDDGLKAAQWLKDKVLDIATKAGRKDVTWEFIATGDHYRQPSLVVRVGADHADDAPSVIISSHMDTISKDGPPFDGVKPGADDDGSGSVLTLEVAEVLLNSNQKFKKPIYFIWYAAEELGLVGSQVVVADFSSKNIKVDSVLHLEVAGYQNQNDSNKLWIITDHVNNNLTNYLEMLALNFSDITEVGRTECGYACSDHASWTAAGYPAAIPCEAKFEESNPNMHSVNDTMEHLNKSHMLKFAKLGLAFVIERAEPLH